MTWPKPAHVAGLVACLMTSGGNSAANIRQLLNDLAIDVGAEGFDNATGVGFVTYLNEAEFDELLPRKTSTKSPKLYSAVVS